MRSGGEESPGIVVLQERDPNPVLSPSMGKEIKETNGLGFECRFGRRMYGRSGYERRFCVTHCVPGLHLRRIVFN